MKAVYSIILYCVLFSVSGASAEESLHTVDEAWLEAFGDNAAPVNDMQEILAGFEAGIVENEEGELSEEQEDKVVAQIEGGQTVQAYHIDDRIILAGWDFKEFWFFGSSNEPAGEGEERKSTGRKGSGGSSEKDPPRAPKKEEKKKAPCAPHEGHPDRCPSSGGGSSPGVYTI